MRKFVKIGRPGYKGTTGSLILRLSLCMTLFHSVSDGKLGGAWEQGYCSYDFVLLISVTKQRDPDSGQHSLFFQVSRELSNGSTSSLSDTRLHS